MKKAFKRLYLIIIFVFLYAPVLTLIVFSFNDSKSRGNWGGFTLKWYGALFRDRQVMSSLYYTIIIALLSAFIATVTGTAAAVGIHNMKKILKSVVMNLTYIPVISPDIVTGISLLILFVFVRLNLGFTTLLLAHITFNIPYVIFPVLLKLTAQQHCMKLR